VACLCGALFGFLTGLDSRITETTLKIKETQDP
jgi:hypothetical protein